MADNQTNMQEYVRSIVDYDPETGIFTWRRREDGRNSRFAGKPAGSKANNYISMKIGKRSFHAHRLAFLWMTGSIPKWVKALDGDLTNTKWSNLCEAFLVRKDKEIPLTQDYLHEILHYDPVTGLFTWRFMENLLAILIKSLPWALRSAIRPMRRHHAYD